MLLINRNISGESRLTVDAFIQILTSWSGYFLSNVNTLNVVDVSSYSG